MIEEPPVHWPPDTRCRTVRTSHLLGATVFPPETRGTVALFGRKNTDESDETPDETKAVFQARPELATKWFVHARTMADASNTETALVYFASGIKFDPANDTVLNEMLDVAKRHARDEGKRISSKHAKPVAGTEPIDKMAMALLVWMTDLVNVSLGIKALRDRKSTRLNSSH